MKERAACIEIGRELKRLNYTFTTITPESHRRVLARSVSAGETLRDLFGWNLECRIDAIPEGLLKQLESADLLESVTPTTVKSRVRFSSLGQLIFVHSKFPTDEPNSVFFGPDSYRFSKFICAKKPESRRVIDLGCGTGVGSIALAAQLNQKPSLILSDSNESALECAEINLHINDDIVSTTECSVIKSHLLDDVPPGADLIIANPPFIIDHKARSYRDGGENYGAKVSVEMAKASFAYFANSPVRVDRRLLMYTGSSIVAGKDSFFDLLKPHLNQSSWSYEELDPDIFGEELSHDQYRDVDRIAAVGLDVLIR